MKTINKKYKIERKLRELSGLVEYKVIEVNREKYFKLSIFNENIMSEMVKKYLINNFEAIKNLNFGGIYSSYELISITNIDGIVTDSTRYGFLSEYSEAEVTFLEFLNSVDEKLVCRGVHALIEKLNTLNVKGFNYTSLHIGDLKVICEKGDCELKLPNILTNEFSKINNIFIRYNKTEYLNGLDLLGEKKSNIEDLIEILKEVSESLKEKNFYIIKVLERVLEKNKKSRFRSINSLNEELNLELKEEKPNFFLDIREKVDKKIDLVGRDIEVENIINIYKEMLLGNENSRTIIFNGEDGVGKTKILETIKNRLEYNFNSPIFYTHKEEGENVLEWNSSMENYNYTRGLKSELNKFIIDFTEKVKLDYISEDAVYTKESCKSINNGLKLVSEYARLRPFVFIVDDFNSLNLFMRTFIRQIVESTNGFETTLVLIGVNKRLVGNTFDRDFLENRGRGNITEYNIEALSKYYTSEFIGKMLNCNDGIDEIVEEVYNETFGNPGFIIKKIVEMQRFKSIYVNKVTGKWIFEKNKTFKNIGYVTEKKYLDQIESLEMEEFKILKKLALYKNILREDLCLEKIIKNKVEMEAFLRLKHKKIIVESYDDVRKNIDFSDKFYKRVLCNVIEEKEKREQHEEYIVVLEKLSASEKSSIEREKYYLELIYHLEEVKDYQKVIKYTYLYIDELFKREEDILAIGAYKKIRKYVKKEELSKIYRDIGDIYDKSEAYDNSLKYYKKANAVAIGKEDKVLSALSLARINIERERFEDAAESIDIAKQNILDLQENREIYARYFLVKALYENGEEAIEFAKKAFTICEKENYKMLKGEVYLVLFKCEVKNKNYEKLERYVSYCEEVFSNAKNGRRCYKTLLYRAMLYMERDKNFEMARKNLEYLLRESKRHKVNSIHYNTLMELANLNCYLNKKEESKKYLLEAVRIIKTDKSLKKYLDKTYKYLLFLSVINRDLKEVITYKNIILDGCKNTEGDIDSIYAMYHYTLGDVNKFREISVANRETDSYWLNIKNENFFIGYSILKIMACGNEVEMKRKLIELEVNLKKKHSLKTYVNIMISICNLLHKLGYLELSKKIFLEIEDRNDMEKVNERDYIVAINNFRYYSENTLLNKCMRIISEMEDSMEKIDFYYIIGENYEMTRCYDLAFEAYYNGLIILSRYIKLENVEDRVHIVRSNVFKRFFRRFLYCGNEKLNLHIELNVDQISNRCINSFLKKIKMSEMLKNRKFKDFIMNKYGKIFLNEYDSMEKVMGNFKEDVIYNIGILMKYITRQTLATTAVLSVNSGKERKVIYSYRNNDSELIERIIKKKLNVDYFIANQDTLDDEGIYSNLLSNSVKALMYLNLRKNYGESSGYKNIECELILVSDRLLNNINEEAIEKIKEYENSLFFLLEQHRVTINSTRDKLTGAYNRGYFERTMDNILREANYLKDVFSLIIFDIDNFKNINDKYGHQKGDVILQEISRIVSENISGVDIFSRYGGEEFTIICPDCDEVKAYEKADKIRRAIDEAKLLRNKRAVTVSMGVASFPKQAKRKNSLIEKADQALYVAKRESKNIVKIWDSEFEGQGESIDRLAGLITGNTSNDYERIESLIEVVDIVRSKKITKEKKKGILNKLVKNTESQRGSIFRVDEEGKIIRETEAKENGKREEFEESYYNYDLMNKVIKNKKGIYDIDWDEMRGDLKSLPKWKSVCIVPIINDDRVKGIIYTYVPSKKKEFSFKDYNYINTAGNILSILY